MPATAPALLAPFQQTPRTRGKKRPELAKQNAHATAPNEEVSFNEATNAPAAPMKSSNTLATISILDVSVFGSITL